VRTPNNAINTDSEKRRAFIAPLFTAGYGERCRGRFAPATTGRRIDIRRLLGASRRTTSG